MHAYTHTKQGNEVHVYYHVPCIAVFATDLIGKLGYCSSTEALM